MGALVRDKPLDLNMIIYRSGADRPADLRSEPEEILAKLPRGLGVKIVYVYVSRSSVVLFPFDTGTADRSGNAAAGTLVDHSIVSSSDELPEFLLKPHCGVPGTPQKPTGTTKPLRFVVARNDLAIPLHDLQQQTFDLSFLDPRAKRSTKYLSVCRLAEQKALRARQYLAEGGDPLADSLARMAVC